MFPLIRFFKKLNFLGKKKKKKKAREQGPGVWSRKDGSSPATLLPTVCLGHVTALLCKAVSCSVGTANATSSQAEPGQLQAGAWHCIDCSFSSHFIDGLLAGNRHPLSTDLM